MILWEGRISYFSGKLSSKIDSFVFSACCLGQTWALLMFLLMAVGSQENPFLKRDVARLFSGSGLLGELKRHAQLRRRLGLYSSSLCSISRVQNYKLLSSGPRSLSCPTGYEACPLYLDSFSSDFESWVPDSSWAISFSWLVSNWFLNWYHVSSDSLYSFHYSQLQKSEDQLLIDWHSAEKQKVSSRIEAAAYWISPLQLVSVSGLSNSMKRCLMLLYHCLFSHCMMSSDLMSCYCSFLQISSMKYFLWVFETSGWIDLIHSLLQVSEAGDQIVNLVF